MSPKRPSLSFPESQRPLPSVNPRKLVPLKTPPAHLLLYPPKPLLKQRHSALSPLRERYDLSTHLSPAAYPRTTPYIPEPENAVAGESKEDRRVRTKRTVAELLSLKDRQIKGEFGDVDTAVERLLWCAANRYVRRDLHVDRNSHSRRKSTTLLFVHANGFPKEIWEPVISYCLQSTSVVIDEIWSLEAVQHGDAAVVNEGKLGALYDWCDNSRDILNFLLHYLPPVSTSKHPLHLHKLSESDTKERLARGFSDRSLVAVGHSFGACTAVLSAINEPKLFDGIIIVDPVISAVYVQSFEALVRLVSGAVQRRVEWPSLEEARRSFEVSPFFQAWDPAVLDVYIECGLAPIEGREPVVRLKQSGIQEAALFSESRTQAETFELLAGLDERVALRWVLGGKPPHIVPDENDRSAHVWRRPANSSNVQIMSAGHLVAQEAPRELAEEISEFLRQLYGGTGDMGRARL